MMWIETENNADNSINIENDQALFMLGQIYQIMEKYEDAELHYNKIKNCYHFFSI